MGTLEEQTRAYEAALVFFENLRAEKDGTFHVQQIAFP